MDADKNRGFPIVFGLWEIDAERLVRSTHLKSNDSRIASKLRRP